MRSRLLPVLVASTVILMGCGSSEEGDPGTAGLGNDALISFAYLDSSVPPQYHRSYELTVRSDESRIVVDSYGDVLAEERVTTDPAVWATLGATLDQVTGLRAQAAEEGCTGGTVTSLTVVEGDSVLVDLVLDECAGANAEAAEAITSWIAPARDQFAPMDVLAPEGP